MKRINNISNIKFLTTGRNSLREDMFNKVKNKEYINKPEGGIWSSPYTENEEYKSDWLRFCIEEDFNTGNIEIGVLFNIKEDSRVFVIDSMDDLKELYKKYKRNERTGSILCEYYLDFEKLALDYDAIYLTSEGEWKTRFPERINSGEAISLYGWDVETLLILNFYCIDKQEVMELK